MIVRKGFKFQIQPEQSRLLNQAAGCSGCQTGILDRGPRQAPGPGEGKDVNDSHQPLGGMEGA